MLLQAVSYGKPNSVTARVPKSCTSWQMQKCNSLCCYKLHGMKTPTLKQIVLLQVARYDNTNILTTSVATNGNLWQLQQCNSEFWYKKQDVDTATVRNLCCYKLHSMANPRFWQLRLLQDSRHENCKRVNEKFATRCKIWKLEQCNS